MKKIFKRGVPLFMALLVLLGVIFTSFESVNATGMETLYYTYWDLMTSIFAAQGYDMQIKDGVVNDHGVTGKQVWENFKTWVKTNAKAVYDEVTLLPKAVTAEGIKMSQELWDAFRDYASICVSGSKSDISSLIDRANATDLDKNIAIMCSVDCGSDGTIDFYALLWMSKTDSYYTPVQSCLDYGDLWLKYRDKTGALHSTSCNGTLFSYSSAKGWYSSKSFSSTSSCHVGSATLTDVWIQGASVGNSDVYSLVSQGACPAEVPDVTPWIKNPTIPDEWRIVQPGEDPKKDPDSNPEKLPVIIPFKPPKPEDPKKPDSTEDTNPDKDKDKDKEKKPAVNPIINPATGNVIDPETGLDIDPNTGKLIDPDTGKLIDPDDGGSGGGGGGIADKLGKYGDITKLFPFCIPFDIVNLIKGMSAEKAPPVFHFKYYFKSINYTFKVDVDLSKYAKYIKLFRYGMQIFYILALMFMTIRISKLFS